MEQHEKPNKKKEQELWTLLEEKISQGNYIFLAHTEKRLKDRFITDIDVLDILENKSNRKRNKSN